MTGLETGEVVEGVLSEAGVWDMPREALARRLLREQVEPIRHK